MADNTNGNSATAANPHRERHWLATVWLAVIFAVNLFYIPWYIYCGDAFFAWVEALKDSLADGYPWLTSWLGDYDSIPNWVWIAFSAINIAILACVAALFHWKRWGFYGLCGLLLVRFIVLVVGFGWAFAVGSVPVMAFDLGVLYLILRLGGTRGTWSQLT